MFKNFAPFTDCMSKINNAQVDAKYLDVVMLMYNLINYNRNYSQISGRTPAAGNKKDVEIPVPLKYLSNFWRTLEIPQIECKITLILA